MAAICSTAARFAGKRV